MTRHSAHDASAVVIRGGTSVAAALSSVRVRLSEARYPYGQADVIVPLPADEAALEVLNPRAGDVRLVLDLRESVGDPVTVAEVTADHGGTMTALTAAFAGTVAAVTAAYFVAWNSDEHAGSSVRANLLLTGREVDHKAGRCR